jgi:hypothetical protein
MRIARPGNRKNHSTAARDAGHAPHSGGHARAAMRVSRSGRAALKSA